MQGVTVLIPSLNPDENLLELTRNLHKLGLCDIVIVNDGSDPSRLHIFDTLANEYHCTIVTHTRNEGKGAALKTGIAAIKELYPNSAGFITAGRYTAYRAGIIRNRVFARDVCIGFSRDCARRQGF